MAIVKGNPCSFANPRASSIDNLKVYFEPKQDFNGYDHPWPPGGGKNILHVNSAASGTLSDVVVTSDDNYVILNGEKYGQSLNLITSMPITLAAGTYYARAFKISGTLSSGAYLNFKFYADQSTSITGALATEQTFTLSAQTTFYLAFELNDHSVFTDYKLGVVISTTSDITEYSPYANICPITGWTAANIYNDPKYDREINFNQLVIDGNLSDGSDWDTYNATYSKVNSVVNGEAEVEILSIPPTNYYLMFRRHNAYELEAVIGHKYLHWCEVYAPTNMYMFATNSNGGGDAKVSVLANTWTFIAGINIAQRTIMYPQAYPYLSQVAVGQKFKYRNFANFDLTQMFGEETADYIYSLEQNEAGAGIAWFRNLFYKMTYGFTTGVKTTVSAVNGDPCTIIPVTYPAVGKNLFDKNNYTALDAYINVTITSSGSHKTVYIPCSPNTSYVVSNGSGNSRTNVGYTDVLPAANVTVNEISGNGKVTTGANAKYLVVYCYNGILDSVTFEDVVNSLQIEVGSTATTYEAFNNTVYGGYIDLTTGQLVEEWASVDLGSLTYSKGSLGGHTLYMSSNIVSPSSKSSSNTIISEQYKLFSSKDDPYPSISLSGLGYLFIVTDQYSDATTLKASLSGQKAYYQRETPIVYNLTPQQLESFVGNNNFFSNMNGDIEAEFTQYSDQGMESIRRKIMLNSPHIKSAAAKVVSFNTDLAAPLQKCVATILPYQNLNGYSKPWPPGGGKNKLDYDTVYATCKTGDNIFTGYNNALDGALYTTCEVPIGDYIGQQVTFSAYVAITGSTTAIYPIATINGTNTTSGATQVQGSSAGYITITCTPETSEDIIHISYGSGRGGIIFKNIMLELGSERTKWEAYSNVCPIQGHTDITVKRTGKSLVSAQEFFAAASNFTTTTEDNKNCVSFRCGAIRICQGVKFKENTRYTISFDAKAFLWDSYTTYDSSALPVRFIYTDGTKHYVAVSPNDGWKHISETSMANKTIDYIDVYGVEYRLGCYVDIDSFMLEEGTTATTYEPYVGTTIPYTMPVQGKNLFKTSTSSKEQNGVTWTANNDDTVTVSGTASGYSGIDLGKCSIPTGETITVSGLTNTTNLQWDQIVLYDDNDQLVEVLGSLSSADVTINLQNYSGATQLRLYVKRSSNNTATSGTIKPMVEVGSSATTYEAYTNTVYGGELDLLTGVFKKQYIKITLNGSETYTLTQRSNMTRFNLDLAAFGYRANSNLYCWASYLTQGEDDVWQVWIRMSGSNLLRINAPVSINTTESFCNYLAAHPLEVSYRVATTEYQLTPQQLKALKGQNNIWCDSETSVKYWTH